MPVLFVAVGQPLIGAVRTIQGPWSGKSAEIRFFQWRDDVWHALPDPVHVTLHEDDTRFELATEDLLQPQEMQTQVRYELWFADKQHATSREPIIVYRRRVEVHGVDADGAPVCNAFARLRVTVDNDFVATGKAFNPHFTRHPDGAHEYEQSTGDSGIAVFEDLPPGAIVTAWAPPYRIAEDQGWLEGQGFSASGPLRKSPLADRPILARLVSPVAGQRTQWVNLDPNQEPAEANAGEMIDVVVQARGADDDGLAGDRVFLKVEAAEGNSPRTGDPRPSVGEEALGTEACVKYQEIPADGGSVTFQVCVGVAGGDEFTLSVGGTPDCADETINVVTWRKIFARVIAPSGIPALAIPDDVKSGMKAIFERGFIEIEFRAGAFSAAQAPSHVNLREPAYTQVPAVLSLDPQQDNLVYTTDTAAIFYSHHYANEDQYPPTIFIATAAHAILQARPERFFFNGSSRSEVRISNKLNFLLPEPVGVLSNIYSGNPDYGGNTWTGTDNEEHPVTDAHILVQCGESRWQRKKRRPRRFKFTLPSDSDHALKSPDERGGSNVSVALQTYKSEFGGSVGRWFWARMSSNDSMSIYTLAHELGHSLGLVVEKPAQDGLSDKPDNVHVYDYTGKHCSYGAVYSDHDKDERGATDWQEVVRNGHQGICLMFSPLGAKSQLKNINLCPVCIAHLRAYDVRKTFR
ncbi:MAG: hypothetical protein JKY37_25585 [Nannocystaceae bacterium]|nr:hypothetical protein [Nannocystaceae bacterium]